MPPQSEDYHASRSLIASAVRDVLRPSEVDAIFTLLSSGLYSLSLRPVHSSSRHAVLSVLSSPRLSSLCSLRLVLSSTPLSSPLSDTNPCLYFPGDVICCRPVGRGHSPPEGIQALRAAGRGRVPIPFPDLVRSSVPSCATDGHANGRPCRCSWSLGRRLRSCFLRLGRIPCRWEPAGSLYPGTPSYF